jgi:hypothetical protein
MSSPPWKPTEPTQLAPQLAQETAPMVGSKCAAFTDHDSKFKVLKKVLTKQDNLVEAKKQ